MPKLHENEDNWTEGRGANPEFTIYILHWLAVLTNLHSELSGEEAASFSNELLRKAFIHQRHIRDFPHSVLNIYMVNSFIKVVYEKVLYKFSQNFMSKAHLKNSQRQPL